MPTLTRLILIVAVICACIYGMMLGLVTWVHPVTTEIILRVPANKMLQQPAQVPSSGPAPAATSFTSGEPEPEDAE